MGKIRVKTLGDEKLEKKQNEEARRRAEAKRAEKKEDVPQEEVSTSVKEKQTDTRQKVHNKPVKKDNVVGKRSTKYLTASQKVDKNKIYSLEEALELLPLLKLTKFDETVELHMNTTEKGLSGNVTLPHGTGKQVRVVIANQSEDPKAVEELVKKVESGVIDFDVLLATPDSMPKLAKIARFLGPRGLMPNPKNGTVTPKPEQAAKKFEGGQINFKTEAKFPILHMSVGKLSFGGQKLTENILVAVEAIQKKNIKTVTLKSTMSPGLKIDTNSL